MLKTFSRKGWSKKFFSDSNFANSGIMACVPTPFYHLSVAFSMIKHQELSATIRVNLSANLGAFLLGNIAPDVQMVSGQPRRTTHFYSLPPEDAIPAWKHLLESCSDLAIPERLPLPKAIFIAGYICHLHADEIWLYDIFLPFFGPGAGWCTQKKRSYLHNVLRSYLDNNVLEVLPGHAGHLLQKACPNNWLPFASDESLVQWRDLVAKQLRPGAQIQTLEVFANRHGLSTEEFYSILKSEERMDSEVFNHLSRRHVMQYRHKIVQANVQFLSQYLDFIS